MWKVLARDKHVNFKESTRLVYYSLIHASIHTPSFVQKTNWIGFQKIITTGSLGFEIVIDE